MRDTVKKWIHFRFDRYEDIENKLAKLAANGLILKECGTALWTFQKSEPQDLKYTVTYFSEGSVYNADFTHNQQTYFDYAEAAGWDFVTQLNQMQIFCSEADNPIPFETDEKEKFDNIKKCMKKSFIPSCIILALVFLLNLLVQFYLFQSDPIGFLSDTSRLCSAFMILTVVIYELHVLFSYFCWCRRTKKSIAQGKGCATNAGKTHKMIELLFVGFIFINFGCIMVALAPKIGGLGLFLSIIQVPILLILFRASVGYFKRKKASAAANRAISFTLLILANFAYLTFILLFIMKFGLQTGDSSDYQTIAWPVDAVNSQEYRLYSDELPLTCEDMYDQINHDYYSYKKEADRTLFLTKNSYRQSPLPSPDAPPRMEYDILVPRFDFVHRIVKDDLLKVPPWRENTGFNVIDNKIFRTSKAYQGYFEDTETGEYVLCYPDKIVVLHLEEPATATQAVTIREKLQL